MSCHKNDSVWFSKIRTLNSFWTRTKKLLLLQVVRKAYWYFLSGERAEFLVCKSWSCRTRELVCQPTRSMWLLNLLKWAIMIINKHIIDWWMYCAVQKRYLLISANLQSNKRQKKETLRFSHQHFANRHLSKREIFHSYKNSQKIFTFFSFLENHLV